MVIVKETIHWGDFNALAVVQTPLSYDNINFHPTQIYFSSNMQYKRKDAFNSFEI